MYDIQRGKSINESFPISLDEGIYLVDSSYDYNQIVKIYNKGLINLKFRNYVFKNELVFAVVIFKYQKMPTGTKFVLSGLVRINDKTIFLNLKVHNIFKNKIFCAIVQLQLRF
ncbi:hypothetical protein MHBO_002874 [Bonamia ostreae]|uniref:Uncharacterized protein n=1 Tax=Bonamia ostreae TaxID=126728 RepID=A0ABV2ANU8_9EUKA